MTLGPENITVASRVMLPTYSILFGLIGFLFLFQDPVRTSGQAFDAAKVLLPIPVWGVIFLSVACLELLAMVLHRRRDYITALIVGAGLSAFWTVLLISAGLQDNRVSFTSAVWVGGWVAAHIASVRSLSAGER